MQLEFEQAMTDFKTMFPDMDVEVIEAILRCNKGAVDATIDQLLAMSTDNQVSSVFIFIITFVCCKLLLSSPPLMEFCYSPQFQPEREVATRNGPSR